MKNYLPSNLRVAFICYNVDPYAEDYRFYKNQIFNELLDNGIPSYRIDSSKHAKVHDLIRFINEISPEILNPIYTNYLEVFKQIFRNENIQIILPIKELPVDIIH